MRRPCDRKHLLLDAQLDGFESVFSERADKVVVVIRRLCGEVIQNRHQVPIAKLHNRKAGAVGRSFLREIVGRMVEHYIAKVSIRQFDEEANVLVGHRRRRHQQRVAKLLASIKLPFFLLAPNLVKFIL